MPATEKSPDCHARGHTCAHAIDGILDHKAPRWSCANLCGGMKKDIRRWLARLNLLGRIDVRIGQLIQSGPGQIRLQMRNP